MSLSKALRLAQTYSAGNKRQKAYSIYKDILKIYPANKEAVDGSKNLKNNSNISLSSTGEPSREDKKYLVDLCATGRFREALDSARKLIRKYPQSFSISFICGAASAGCGENIEALRYYKQAISINPKIPGAHNNLGNCYRALAEPENSIASYKKAIDLDADYFEAHNNLGTVLKVIGDIEGAIKCFKEAIKINTNYFQAHNNLGNALKDSGKYQAALQSYLTALDFNG